MLSESQDNCCDLSAIDLENHLQNVLRQYCENKNKKLKPGAF